MKYIDECYQSRPTLPSYQFSRDGGWGVEGWIVVVVGRDRFACGHRIICFNYKISITTSCALTSSTTSTSLERKSVTLNLCQREVNFPGNAVQCGLTYLFDYFARDSKYHLSRNAFLCLFTLWRACWLWNSFTLFELAHALRLYLGPRGEALWWWRCLGSGRLIALFGWGFPYHNWEKKKKKGKKSSFAEHHQLSFLSRNAFWILPGQCYIFTVQSQLKENAISLLSSPRCHYCYCVHTVISLLYANVSS